MRVLIVEDEPYMAEAIRDGLRLEAIAADIAGDGGSALELLNVNAYDIAVLDRDIPAPSGDEVAARIVASGSGLPILMLTAADRLDDKATGFELGADDYLTKPFELRELVLRLRAHARPPVREIAGLRLDPFRREVYRDGRYVPLTRKQFAVLEVLVAAEGGVVSAEELLRRAREKTVDRRPGLSVRLKLTLSYAGFLMLAGAVLLAAGYFSLSRGVHPGVIFIVQSHADLLRYFAPIAAIVMTFLLVFGLLGGWLLAGRMLAPLTRITDATRTAANGSLAHRIDLGGRQDEFRELADSFDTMLARVEAHVAEQQRFAVNASHELRTPLAITQTLLDVARKDSNGANGELVDRLHAVNTRAIDLTEALLLLSRADQRSFTREHVDLSLIAEEATETLLPLADKRGLTIETSGDMTPTIGSHGLLLQLSTNLVHNAIVHNLPERGTVWVTTRLHPKGVVLTVENTGKNLTPQLVATLAEPFQRGTERIRTDHAGVGLGLAIVKSIAHAHDGTLTLTQRSDGGLPFTVELPPAPSATTNAEPLSLPARRP